MPRDNGQLYNGGPAYPGKQMVMRQTGDDRRPLEPTEVEMNGMSVRDVATLQILSAIISGRCKTQGGDISGLATVTIHQSVKPEWIVEAMDAADLWLELRGQP